MKGCELYVATRGGVSRVEVPGMPAGVESLRRESEQQSLQLHTARTLAGGGQGAVFHGQGMGKDHSGGEILEYFREVDRSLKPVLRQESAPMVFCGVEYLFPIYQQANSYAGLLPTPVLGNPMGTPPEELARQTLPLVEPVLQARLRSELERLQMHLAQGRATTWIEEALPAAREGRVGELFVPLGVERWGNFDPGTGVVTTTPGPFGGSQDLLDLCARQVFLHGGEVFALPPQDMPVGGPLAAVFRY